MNYEGGCLWGRLRYESAFEPEAAQVTVIAEFANVRPVRRCSPGRHFLSRTFAIVKESLTVMRHLIMRIENIVQNVEPRLPFEKR